MTQEPTPHEEGAETSHEGQAGNEPTQEQIDAAMAAARADIENDAAIALEGERDRQAINTGVIKNMQFQQALKMALGQKNIYFSASNESVGSPKGINSANQNGAVYLRPDPNKHLVSAEVLDHSVQGEDLKRPFPEDVICSLPIAYSLKTEKKPIADITDEEAQAAGYQKRALQIRLALQSDKVVEFTQTLASVAAQVIQGRVNGNPNPQQFQMFLGNIIPMVIDGLRYGFVKGDEGMAKQAASIVQVMLNPDLFPDAMIPGTTDIFTIRVAEPAELVEAGQAADENAAKKAIGKACRIIHDQVCHTFGLTRLPIRNEMTDVYGQRGFDRMMNELDAKADTLLGVKDELSPSAKADLAVKALMNHPGNEWKAIQFRGRLEAALDEPAKFDAVLGELNSALEQAKLSADKPRRTLG